MTILDRGLPPPGLPRSGGLLTPRSLDEALHLLAAEGAAVLGGGVGHTLRATIGITATRPRPAHLTNATRPRWSHPIRLSDARRPRRPQPIRLPDATRPRRPQADPPPGRDATSLVSVARFPNSVRSRGPASTSRSVPGVRLGEIEADERLVGRGRSVTEAAGSVATGGSGGWSRSAETSPPTMTVTIPVALAAAGATLTCGASPR